MTRSTLLAVLLLAAGPSRAQIRGVEPVGGPGEFGGPSAGVQNRELFSAQTNQLITVLQGAGLGFAPSAAPNVTPLVAPVATAAGALQASQVLAAAVQASPAALAAPARQLLAALSSPNTISALEPQLDAPTYARLTAMSAEVRSRPEVFSALSEIFKKTEGDKPFDKALLDAVFDGGKTGALESTPVLAAASGLTPSGLHKSTAEKAVPPAEVPAPHDAAVLKKAGIHVAGWIAAAMAFGAGIHHFMGVQAFKEYLTTYVIEWSMSLDNLVVISAALLAVPQAVRGKALRWGLIGTILARLIMVSGGVGLLSSDHWLFIGFGAFLLANAVKMIWPKIDAVGWIANGIKKILPKGAGGFYDKLAAMMPGRFKTPFALGVLAVVGYGVIFALDSVSASLALSKNWFVIFSANAFSVMGLGALFSVIEWLNRRFEHLPKGVAAVLAFVGLKMIVEPMFGLTIGITESLAVIGTFLGGSALYSLVAARRSESARQ